MKNIFNAIPKKILAVILFLVSIVVILLVIVFLPQPTQTPPSQPSFLLPTPYAGVAEFAEKPPLPILERQITNTPQIIWNITNPNLKTSARIYKTQYVILGDRAAEIAKRFGFTTQPEIFENPILKSTTATWMNAEQDQILSITQTSGYIEYLNNVIQGKADVDSKPLPRIESRTQVVENARNYLSSHGLLPPGITTSANNVRLFNETQSHPEEVDEFPNATLYQAVFIQQVDTVPIYVQYGSPLDISVWLTNTNIVKKVSFFYTQIIGRSPSYRLFNFAQIKVQLETGNGLFYTLGSNGELIDNPNFSSVQFNSIQLVYVDDRTSGYIHPYFLLKGSDNATGNEVRAYLSAVQN